MTDTLAYYNENAERFFRETVHIDMTALYERFLARIPAGGWILDAGCGSGRDAKAFIDRGYRVTAFDASPSLTRLASQHVGQPVAQRTFTQVTEQSTFDGVWACASLIHLPAAAIPEALQRLWDAIKPGGALYLSFKVGNGEREHNGRHFTDADEPRLRHWLDSLPELADASSWITTDQRPGNSQQWLNALAIRRAISRNKLVTGDTDPFLPHLCAAINQASSIDLAVAFVKTTGLRLLLPDLHGALETNRERQGLPVQMRVLTSDYLDVTDPDALRLLLLLQQQGAKVRVYESANSSFHMKAYLFARFSDEGQLRGTAFIGSSNISRQALQNGLEWNYRVDYPGDTGFLEARNRFEELFADPRTVPLSDTWIEKYETRRVPLPRAVAPGSLEREPPPKPTAIQIEALLALAKTREDGFRRGLVVLPTGVGKTWLAAFDVEQFRAGRVLFVAHREEILTQAAETFLRIRPRGRVGFYMGQKRDIEVDVLCASVQTLSRAAHLDRFSPRHFDYIVVDEFHHASASTYRRLLGHFAPRFLLGLTATPDRTDNSDILSLCDDNLVFTRNLFEAIRAGLLVPFHYYGIYDEEVDYREIPWRNGRFDPDALTNKLATLARARHALTEWRRRAKSRTLAFCVSIRHAEFMAEHFTKAGVLAAAVYSGSTLGRHDALERLNDGRLQVLFSVDLFNEGVDLPTIDTVMLLRPTESKILFLQQLGRGLRIAEGKDQLIAMDFIGNHQSFLHKPQALFGTAAAYRQLAEFARRYEQGRLQLPDGCYVNYDLKLIAFLKSLDSEGIQKEYEALRQGLGRRPSLNEFFRAGVSLTQMRQQHGSWFELVETMGDLSTEESSVVANHRSFLRALETTPMTRSFKMVLLEAFQEMDGWRTAPPLSQVAERSWQVLQRRRPLLADLPDHLRNLPDGTSKDWQRYWRENPVNAWVGGNLRENDGAWFKLVSEHLVPVFRVVEAHQEPLANLVQEIVNYRLTTYEARSTTSGPDRELPRPSMADRIQIPFFPNIRIACGHFKTGTADAEEYRTLSASHGRLDPARHFVARASGNSMNGGKNPIRDGDYLLLEYLSPTSAGSITGTIMAIERQDKTGDDQYLLRVVTKASNGDYILKAKNPDYKDIVANDEMRTFARLKTVLDPLELAIGQPFMREEIPALFGESFNPGNWHSGHVVLNSLKAQVLLVTLNKQGKAEEHRYIDHWIDEHTFHWQSQNATTPTNKRGQEIIEHEKRGITIHLFVRDSKLVAGKAAPFIYHGPVRYRSHVGSEPMSVTFEVNRDR